MTLSWQIGRENRWGGVHSLFPDTCSVASHLVVGPFRACPDRSRGSWPPRLHETKVSHYMCPGVAIAGVVRPFRVVPPPHEAKVPISSRHVGTESGPRTTWTKCECQNPKDKSGPNARMPMRAVVRPFRVAPPHPHEAKASHYMLRHCSRRGRVGPREVHPVSQAEESDLEEGHGHGEGQLQIEEDDEKRDVEGLQQEDEHATNIDEKAQENKGAFVTPADCADCIRIPSGPGRDLSPLRIRGERSAWMFSF